MGACHRARGRSRARRRVSGGFIATGRHDHKFLPQPRVSRRNRLSSGRQPCPGNEGAPHVHSLKRRQCPGDKAYVLFGTEIFPTLPCEANLHAPAARSAPPALCPCERVASKDPLRHGSRISEPSWRLTGGGGGWHGRRGLCVEVAPKLFLGCGGLHASGSDGPSPETTQVWLLVERPRPADRPGRLSTVESGRQSKVRSDYERRRKKRVMDF